jgi:iron-sulfur cluster repair protein YtfE (RIC family)
MPPNIPTLAHMQVNEVIQQFPETLRVFHAVGIDSCCGGALVVQQAAERHGLDMEALIADLRAAMTDARQDAVTPR